MKTKFAILGGGVAGLCAAITLTELGERPLLIDGGSFSTHKVCGEFLSPECIDLLQRWHIQPNLLTNVNLHTACQQLNFHFNRPAGALSHIELDPALANHAAACGAQLKSNTLVSGLQPKKTANDVHLIQLADGQEIEAQNLIIATGRLFKNLTASFKARYIGFKTHFSDLSLEKNQLQMYVLEGAYCGIAPIENNKFNVACLAELKQLRGCDPQIYLQNLFIKDRYLQSLLANGKNIFEQWMVASIPAFGFKKTPLWHDTFFIGDAATSIPPACGNGLALAILGGRLAAQYALNGRACDFKKMWHKRCAKQMFYAKLLHKIMLSKTYSNATLQVIKYFPYFGKKLFELSRQSGIL